MLDALLAERRCTFDPNEYGQGIILEGWNRFARTFQAYRSAPKGMAKSEVYQALENLYRAYYLMASPHMVRRYEAGIFHEFFHPILGEAMRIMELPDLSPDSMDRFLTGLWSEGLRERALKFAGRQQFQHSR